jgi:hypothetical protein
MLAFRGFQDGAPGVLDEAMVQTYGAFGTKRGRINNDAECRT